MYRSRSAAQATAYSVFVWNCILYRSHKKKINKWVALVREKDQNVTLNIFCF